MKRKFKVIEEIKVNVYSDNWNGYNTETILELGEVWTDKQINDLYQWTLEDLCEESIGYDYDNIDIISNYNKQQEFVDWEFITEHFQEITPAEEILMRVINSMKNEDKSDWKVRDSYETDYDYYYDFYFKDYLNQLKEK